MIKQQRLDQVMKLAARQSGNRANQSKQKKMQTKKQHLAKMVELAEAFKEVHEALTDAHEALVESAEVLLESKDEELEYLVQAKPFDDPQVNKRLENLQTTIIPKLVPNLAASAQTVSQQVKWFSVTYSALKKEIEDYKAALGEDPDDQANAPQQQTPQNQGLPPLPAGQPGQPANTNQKPQSVWQKVKNQFT